MLTVAAPTGPEVRRLWTPAPKVAARLEREAIKRVATEMGEPFDHIEEIYRSSRSTIAHLRHHAHEPTHLSVIREKVKELVELTDKFLAGAEKERYGTAAWRTNLANAAKKLSAKTEEARLDALVVPAQIEVFLKVADAARKLYEEDSYEFSGFVDQQIYVLAGMVVANFGAYNKTLNE